MFKKMAKRISNESSLIFTTIGCIGFAYTLYSAVKETPKALSCIENTKQEKGEEILTKIEVIRSCWTCYIPTAIIGVTSLSLIYGSCIVSRRRQANLIGAYALLDRGFKEYREKVCKIYGEEADRIIQNEVIRSKGTSIKPPSDGEVLIFYEENYGEFFERRMSEVLDAEYQLNRKFVLEGEASLNDFYEFLGLKKMKIGDMFGWSIEQSYDFYGYSWIEFEHELIELDDGMECYAINMPYRPEFGFRSI